MAAPPPPSTRVLSALLVKNWRLRTRGVVACCSAAELIIPLIFVSLLTIPRTLLPAITTPTTYFSARNVSDLGWSSVPPPGGDYRIAFAPNGSVSAVAIAEMAAKQLLCSQPSVMLQLALAASVTVDVAAAAAAGLTTESCASNPAACAGYVKLQDGGLPLTSPLISGDYRAMCAPGCLALRACFGPILAEFLSGYPDEAAAVAAAGSPSARVAAVIVIPDAAADDVTYTIRTNATLVPSTSQFGKQWAHVAFDQWVVGPSGQWRNWWMVLNLQRAFDEAIISWKAQPNAAAAALLRLGGVADVTLDTTVKQHATAMYTTNLGGSFAGLFFGVAFVFAFLSSVVLILKSLVTEKELRIREGMLIMGCPGRAYWVSWLATHYFSLVIVSVGMALIGTRAFEYSDPCILLAFYLVWTLQLVTFCYALSAVFSTSKIATIAGSLIYILTWVPAVASTSGDGALGNAGWLATCILPASSLYMWGLAVAILENAQQGVQGATLFRNLLYPVDGGEGATFSAGGVLFISLGGAFANAALAWYLDKAWPQPYGQRQPFWFPLSRTWWRHGHCDQPSDAAESSKTLETTDAEVAAHALLDGGCEPGGADRVATLSLRGLCRTFSAPRAAGGAVAAVQQLSLRFFGGEISALLGHNGAGKTTTMSMLCGMLAPSGGSARLGSLRVGADAAAIRSSLGYCPQHDVLWPGLTCTEHLQLYLAFRGVEGSEAAAAINAVLEQVGLSGKEDAAAGTLSGGQKRKLSLAIAFAGASPAAAKSPSPSFVLLDEPTTGMDAFSRRAAWDFIRSQRREGRTIVLSTHFMEEADLLSDRIALLRSGRLACVGSPLFLKSRLGLGYHLELQLARGAPPSCAASLGDIVRRHCARSVLESHVGAELSFLLPPGEEAELPALLRELGSEAAALGCDAFGLAATTMEEVFLSVSESAEGRMTAEELRTAAVQRKLTAADARRGTEESPAEQEQSAAAPIRLLAGWQLWFAQLRALLRKRLMHAKRDRLTWVTQYCVPVAFISLALGLAHLGDSAGALPGSLMGPSFLASKPVRAAASSALEPAELAAFRSALAGGDTAAEWLPHATQWRCSPLPGAANAAAAGALAAYSSALLSPEAASSCQPMVFNCSAIGCTAEGPATAATLDAAVLQTDSAHMNCRQAPGAACGSLFLSDASRSRRRFAFTVAASPSAFHALPALQSAADSAVLSALLGRPGSLRVYIHPLPDTAGGGGAQQQALMLRLLVGLCAVLGLGSLSASAAVFLISERRCGAKHLQRVSGCGRASFWTATVLWDLANYSIPFVLFVIAFAASGLPAFCAGVELGVVCATLVLFAASALPLSYLLSFAAEDEMSGLASQLAMYYFFGIAQTLAAVIMQGLAALGKAVSVWHFCRSIFRWLPVYNVAIILVNLAENADPSGAHVSPWSDNVAGASLKCMLAECFIFGAAALAVDARADVAQALRRVAERFVPSLVPAPPKEEEEEEEDADVAAERARVDDLHCGDTNILTLRSLSKTYGNGNGRRAVRSLSLGVEEGRCFGLLGVNGAGKTTTFSMLTGAITPSGGDAFVRDRCGEGGCGTALSVTRELSAVRQLMGLCPQEDALLALLTPREHLLLFAQLRGVPAAAAPALAAELLSRLGLERWADRPSCGLSGGNRRKAGVALALIGEPPLVLLDEPSSGMDPGSRRAMWDVLAKATPRRAMLLTTHVLQEAEALCHNLGIMVGGQLRCLGSPTGLKARHGEGYTLECRHEAQQSGTVVAAAVARALPAARLQEAQPGRLTFSLSRADGCGVAEAYESLERMRASGLVLDFSLSAATLESIFVRFASEYLIPRIPRIPRKSSLERLAAHAAADGVETVDVDASSVLPLAPVRQFPVVQCPCCRARLRWTSDAEDAMRCGRCDALLAQPAPATGEEHC